MQEHTLLKIGEFARVGQVSIATLRHYDQYGLLKPNALDHDTNYRYYSLNQLPRLHRILALKDLGFPLEHIAQILEHNLSLEQLHTMFQHQQTQTQHMIDREQARLTRIAARLHQIEQEGKMPTHEVLLKHIDPILVISVRDTIPLGDNIERSHQTISAYLNAHHIQPAQPALLLLHSSYTFHGDTMSIDVEAAVPLAPSAPLAPLPSPTTLPDNAHINTRTLPGGLVACTIHTGDTHKIGQAHMALRRWINANGYQLIAPPRYLYLQHTEDIDPAQHITELQFPVRKQT
jgi:DNA-binding transcriptional MerR regulator